MKKTAEEIANAARERSRRYRERHRDEINARRRASSKNMSPEQKARHLEYNRRWNRKRRASGAHPYKRFFTKHMTPDEKKAHRSAYFAEWRTKHAEHVKELARKYYEKFKDKRRVSAKNYRDAHYQEMLARERMSHRKRNDRTRTKAYHPKPSMRVPTWCETPRDFHISSEIGRARITERTIPFSHAVQDGLSVKHSGRILP